jgi:predicted dehydrogenase
MATSIGILGAAGIAPAAVIRPARRLDDVRVLAVASRGGAVDYAARHGIERSFDSYSDLLADPEVDLVYNALPPSLHAEWTIAALEAGKDVLCEKPFTITARQAERVVAAAERTGRRAIEAFHDHYHPLSARTREIVSSGTLGEITRIRAVFTGSNPFDPSSIRHDPAVGGGALMDLGCYPVHWLRHLVDGEPTVASARATENPLGADLTVEAVLRSETGVSLELAASMVEGVPLESSLVVEGTRGRLAVDNLVFPAHGHAIEQEIDGVLRVSTVAGDETYDHQLDAVVRGIASGEQLPTEGADSIANMRVIDEIYAAAGYDRPWT